MSVRSLLDSTECGKVIVVSKQVLDTKRPLGKPSAEEVEEGLQPYEPLISVDGTAVLNGYQPVKTALLLIQKRRLMFLTSWPFPP